MRHKEDRRGEGELAMIPLGIDPGTVAEMLAEQLREEPLFVREDRAVVEVCADGAVAEMTPARFVTWAGRRCFLYNRKKNGETIRGKLRLALAGQVLASEELQSRLRPLRRVVPVRIPVMDDDGTVRLAAPGYDAQSGIVVLDHVKFDEDWDVERAATWIRGFVKDFPWGDDGRSLAVWVASLMSVYCRELVSGPTPMFVFLGNRQGCGKTLLAKMGPAVVYGRAGVAKWEHDCADLCEFLNSAVLIDAPFLIFDNVKGDVSSDVLEAFLTSRVWTLRRLHSQRLTDYEKNMVVLLTGNDATISDDLIRVSLVVNLFSRQTEEERATARSSMEIDEWRLSKNDLRREFLAAMWAIVRHWAESAKPTAPAIFPGYHGWGDVVAGMVVAAGFADPIGISDLKKERQTHDGGSENERP